MCTAFTPHDAARIDALQPETWSDIRPFFRFYAGHAFCRPLKIEIGADVAAVGTVIFNRDTAWLAHIIVHPGYRRQGLGERITRRLVRLCEAAGVARQLLIATDMGRPLYERLGFEVSCDYVFHGEGRVEAGPPPDGVRALDPRRDRDALLDLDRRATGEDRRDMILTACARGWVAESGPGRLAGFYLPDLGDGAVVASDPAAGVALLRRRLSEAPQTTVLPAGNAAALAFLAEHAIAATKTAARMVRGGVDPLRPGWLFQRVGGHFG